MPGLQGAALGALLAKVAPHAAVALDLNEATDDAALPLGTGDKAYSDVAVLHANVEEAAAAVGRKGKLLAAAAARATARPGIQGWPATGE